MLNRVDIQNIKVLLDRVTTKGAQEASVLVDLFVKLNKMESKKVPENSEK
jgi:hypothetical protein